MIQITLLYPSLLYDTEQLIEQYSLSWYENPEERFEANLRMQEGTEGDLLRRLVMTGCSRLKQRLNRYLEQDAYDADDSQRNDKQTDYLLKCDADGQAMADLMHWYVVRYALSEWCKMRGHYKEASAEGEELKESESAILAQLKKSGMPRKMGKGTPPTRYIHNDSCELLP